MNSLNLYFYIAMLITLLISLKRGSDLLNFALILLLLHIIPNSFIFDFKLLFHCLINFVLGIFISKRIANFFFYCFFRKTFDRYNIKYIPHQFMVALREEVVWRHFLVYFIYFIITTLGFSSIFALIVAELVSIVSFLSVHSLENKTRLFEFSTFLILITVLSLIMPGLNISLHMTRNILIVSNLNLESDYEKL